MSETIKSCPLEDGLNREIPEFCSEHCQALIDQALQEGKFDGEYDKYPTRSHQQLCDNWDTTSLEFSSDSLHRLDGAQRMYVIVDQCSICAYEVGEQGYVFECPFDETAKLDS